MPRLTVPGGEMSYLDQGTGSPVVLVHGTPSSSQEWRHVAADLSRDHRVLAPDHLGFGDSTRAADWRVYSFDWHTANLRSWLEQLALPSFHPVPVLLVWGKADRVIPPVHLERWRKHFPDAQLLALDDVGHFPQIEAPEDVSAAMRRRFSSISSTTSQPASPTAS